MPEVHKEYPLPTNRRRERRIPGHTNAFLKKGLIAGIIDGTMKARGFIGHFFPVKRGTDPERCNRPESARNVLDDGCGDSDPRN